MATKKLSFSVAITIQVASIAYFKSVDNTALGKIEPTCFITTRAVWQYHTTHDHLLQVASIAYFKSVDNTALGNSRQL